MSVKVGINGFGRIGRVIFRTCFENPQLVITAINDPVIDAEYICYLIKFDSTHGRFKGGAVTYNGDEIFIEGCECPIKVFHQKQPNTVPWETAEVQYVVEASGLFLTLKLASGHLESKSVQRVIVTAPSVDIPMIIIGINDYTLDPEQRVVSCTSSTLYCLALIVKVLDDRFGVRDGFVTSIHAMTPSLKPVDGLCLRGKHWRDHRSIHQNIIPATTGACKALGKILPQVKDRLTGLAFRVPIVNVSVLDLTIRLGDDTCLEGIIEEVDQFSKVSNEGLIKVSNEDAVSSDFLGDPHSCILDVGSSLQLKPNYYKLICWYENEYSYACRVVDTINFSINQYRMYACTSSIPTFVRTRSNLPTIIRQGNKRRIVRQIAGHRKNIYNLRGEYSSEHNHLQGSHTCVKVPFSEQNSQLHDFSENKSDTVTTKMLDDGRINKSVTSCRKGNTLCHGHDVNSYDKSGEMQNRFQTIKQEFIKMVNITENLMKKTCQNKNICQNNNNIPNPDVPEEVPVKDDSGDKTASTPQFESTCLEEAVCVQTSVSGDNNEDKSYNDDNKKKTKEENQFPLVKDTTETSDNVKPKLENPFYNSRDCRKTFRICNCNVNNNIQSWTENIVNQSINRTDNECPDFDKATQVSKKEMLMLISDIIKTKTAIDVSVSNSGYESNIEEETCETNRIDFEKITHAGFETRGVYDEINDTFGEVVIKDNDELPGHTSPGDSLSPANSIEMSGSMDHSPSITLKGNSSCENVNPFIFYRNVYGDKQRIDIYEQLDSASNTDSENSFKGKRSQIINIADVTNSLDDLERLDKICKIIEISDDLSDRLLANLQKDAEVCPKNRSKWSISELCERINLDKFCDEMFGKNAK